MAQQRPSPVARCREEVAPRVARGWSREQLAAWLGVSLDGLAALALEQHPQRPVATAPPVEIQPPPKARVAALANHYGANVRRLAEALGVRLED